MRRENRIGLVLLAGALALGLLAPTVACAAAGTSDGRKAELKKLHVLVVLDTNSSLEPELRIDQGHLETLFQDNVPRERLALKVFTGKQVTREAILAHYRSLKVSPNDALLFFYGGHGGRTPAGKPFFYLSNH